MSRSTESIFFAWRRAVAAGATCVLSVMLAMPAGCSGNSAPTPSGTNNQPMNQTVAAGDFSWSESDRPSLAVKMPEYAQRQQQNGEALRRGRAAGMGGGAGSGADGAVPPGADAEDAGGAWAGDDDAPTESHAEPGPGMAPEPEMEPSADPAAPADMEGRAELADRARSLDARMDKDEAATSGRDSLARRPAAQSTLKAGTRDDNEKFDDYLGFYHGHEGRHVVRFDITERYVVTVRDRDGRHVPNALVEIGANGRLLYRGVTDSRGCIHFYPRGYGDAVNEQVTEFQAVVSAEGERVMHRFARDTEYADADVAIRLQDTSRAIPSAVPVNVCFLIDTTGSMGDEIEALRSTLDAVVERISTLSGNPQLNYGMVLFRDRGDQYVTQVHDFVPDLAEFRQKLARVSAGGGGDTPEDVQSGLDHAVNKMSWPQQEGINLMFLIADARPHLDYGDQPSYVESCYAAMEKGIKVFSLAASGLDSDGEFAFRQMAHLTGGKFIFLTYGANNSTPHQVGEAGTDYQSNKLDDVIVRVVNEEVTQFITDPVTR